MKNSCFSSTCLRVVGMDLPTFVTSEAPDASREETSAGGRYDRPERQMVWGWLANRRLGRV